MCFRPLTGLLFFYPERLKAEREKARKKFPSPYGAFVFLPGQKIFANGYEGYLFPSPYGAFVFLPK